MKKILFSIMAAMSVMPSMAQSKTATTRDERNYIVEGNKLYNEQRYADAEVAYRKALQENAMNEIAQFNLAASLLRQGSASGETQKEASAILQNLTRDAENISIAEKAFYNLGNIAFNSQDYAKSIELYKNALRKNPDNDKARENLRLAQKRLEDQQNQDQNQDQNKDKQNQDKKNQDKQDQNQNQNQNNDQNKDDKKDQQQQQPDQKQDQQQKQQQQGGISQQNAEKILKAMENEENATRARINAEKKKTGAPSRRPVTNPW
ncbi:tetratricopeptide repeat protein [uncultured Duncaniella sp.]|uniref:tetratricopeptide repeat protein n=1 Tax=uncultured Duncaniella sp. TaxID=2768039 RepID=UPI0025A99E8A|nr:tetratricopeptide repeat protein [uncultured Duncaniella sp.]